MKVYRGYDNEVGPISHAHWIYVTPDIEQAKWYATKDGEVEDGDIIEYDLDVEHLRFLSLSKLNSYAQNENEIYSEEDLLWYQEGLGESLYKYVAGIVFEDPHYKGHMIYIVFSKEHLKNGRVLSKEEFEKIELNENVIKSRQGVEFIAYHGSKEPNMTPRENYPLYLCDDYNLALAFAKGEVQNDGLYDDEIPTIFTFKGRFDKPYYMPEDQYDIEGQDDELDYNKWVDDGYDGIIVQGEGKSKYYIVLDASKIKLVDKKEFPEYSNNYEDDEEFLTENDEIYNDEDITDKEPELGDSLKFQIKNYLFEIEHLKDEEDMGGEEYYETYIYTKFYRPDSTDFFWNIIGSRIERSWEGCLRYIETFKKAHNLPIITTPDETGEEYIDLDESVKPLEIKNSPKIYEINSLNDIKGLLNKFKFGARGIMNNNTGHIFICDNDELIHHHLAMIVNKNMEPIETYSKFAFYNDYDKALDSEYANGGLWGYDWELYSDDDLYVWMCENDLSGTALQLTANMDYIEPPEEKIQNWMPLNESIIRRDDGEIGGYYTYNANELMSIIENRYRNDDVRVLYDIDKKIYMVGDTYSTIHFNLLLYMILFTDIYDDIPEIKDNKYADDTVIQDIINDRLYLSHFKVYRNNQNISDKEFIKYLKSMSDNKVDGYSQGYTCKLNNKLWAICRDDEISEALQVPLLQNKTWIDLSKNKQLDESKNINTRKNPIYVSDSFEDVLLTMKTRNLKTIKVVYDESIKKYIYGETKYFVHWSLILHALENGLYPNADKIENLADYSIYHSNKCDCFAISVLPKEHSLIEDDLYPSKTINMYNMSFYIYNNKKEYIKKLNESVAKPFIWNDPSYSQFHRILRDNTTYGKLSAVIDGDHIYCWDSAINHHDSVVRQIEESGIKLSDDAIWVRFKEPNLCWVSASYFDDYTDDELDDLPQQDFEKELENNPVIKKYFPNGVKITRFDNLVEGKNIKKLNEELIHAEMSNWDDDIMAVVLKNPSKKELSDNGLTTSRFICFGDTWLFFDSMQWIHEAIYDKYRSKFSELSNMGFYDLEENEFIFIESLEDDDNKEEIKYYTNKSKKWLLNQPYIVNTFGKDFNVRICGEWVTNPW